MTEVTVGSRKVITTNLGCEVMYLSTVADGYTYTSRFGSAKAAFFQPKETISSAEPASVGCSISGGTVTLSISGTITAGYLQVWGE